MFLLFYGADRAVKRAKMFLFKDTILKPRRLVYCRRLKM